MNHDFRLAFLQPQLAADALRATPEQLTRIRPLNDRASAGAAARVQAVHPRIVVSNALFLPHGTPKTARGACESVFEDREFEHHFLAHYRPGTALDPPDPAG